MELSARNLSKAYGHLWALREATFTLKDGDCAALLGPNGAGKTTLLKVLSGILKPTSGEIIFRANTSTGTGGVRSRSVIGYLSPHEHFFDPLTTRENLIFFLSLYGKDRKGRIIEDALDRLGLLSWADAPFSSLSSGMKCRLGIAKWILLRPRLLLVDEPYGTLDERGTGFLDDYLKVLCREGGTVLLATHQVGRAQRVCSRALILRDGKLVRDIGPQDSWATASLGMD